MGLSNSFVSLGRIIGPLLAGYIFDINILMPYLAGDCGHAGRVCAHLGSARPGTAPAQT